MGKIVIVSGLLEGPFESGKSKIQKRSFFESILLFFAKFFGKKGSFIMRLSFFLSRNGIGRAILCGNMQKNKYKERGLVLDEDVSGLEETINALRHRSGMRVEMIAGNYELGYSGLPFNFDSEAGISEDPVQNFLKAAGREKLFHSFLFGGKRFVLIPYLFMEKDRKCWLKNLENEFAAQFVEEINRSEEPIIVIAHDFDSLRDYRLNITIRSLLKKGKIEKIFAGHNTKWQFALDQKLIWMFNSLWSMPLFIVTVPFAMLGGSLFYSDCMIFEKIRAYYHARQPILGLAEALKPIIIPAPNSIFGGGILVYDTETGKVTVEKI